MFVSLRFVAEHRNPVSPRFNERVSPAPIRIGETIVLSCISQGIPPPMYLWFRESVSGSAMIFNSERVHAREGVLVLQSARAEDAGRYVCHANNTAGSERVELEVSIISSLSIHLAAQQVSFCYSVDPCARIQPLSPLSPILSPRAAVQSFFGCSAPKHCLDFPANRVARHVDSDLFISKRRVVALVARWPIALSLEILYYASNSRIFILQNLPRSAE